MKKKHLIFFVCGLVVIGLSIFNYLFNNHVDEGHWGMEQEYVLNYSNDNGIGNLLGLRSGIPSSGAISGSASSTGDDYIPSSGNSQNSGTYTEFNIINKESISSSFSEGNDNSHIAQHQVTTNVNSQVETGSSIGIISLPYVQSSFKENKSRKKQDNETFAGKSFGSGNNVSVPADAIFNGSPTTPDAAVPLDTHTVGLIFVGALLAIYQLLYRPSLLKKSKSNNI